MLACCVQAFLVTAEHPPEDRNGALLGLCMSASEADQASWAMLASGKRAKMRSHVAQVAARRKGRPLLCCRVLYAIFAIVCVVKTTNRLPILFDEPGWIELGVDHHRVRRRMAEKRLDDVHGRVVIQMFRCKNAPTIVREKHRGELSER